MTGHFSRYDVDWVMFNPYRFEQSTEPSKKRPTFEDHPTHDRDIVWSKTQNSIPAVTWPLFLALPTATPTSQKTK
eukprot:3011202-Ditylum_brightwellii.AAC.1